MRNVSYSLTLAPQMISINQTPEGEVFLPRTHHFLVFLPQLQQALEEA